MQGELVLNRNNVSKNILFLNTVPVILLQIVLLISWILFENTGLFQGILSAHIIFNLVIIPAVLIMLNFSYCLKNKRYFIFSYMGLVLTILAFCQGMYYLSWGITTGPLLNPGEGMLSIMNFFLLLNLITVLAMGSLMQFVLLKKKRRIDKAASK
jgi:hypothetical protein